MHPRISQVLCSFVKGAGLAAVSLWAFGPAAAHAENQFNAGAMCISTDAASLDVTTLGGVQNASSAPMTVVCPVVRGAFAPGNTMLGKVFVNDSHYYDPVCCSARSRNPAGTSFLFSADDCTSGTANYVSLDMAVSGALGTWDYRYIVCTLPEPYLGNKSGISGFRGTEM